jgi:curved DNA-binding protein CbpA
MLHTLADHLSILKVTESATATEVKAAYHREMVKWHPDHASGDPARQLLATEHAKKINAAFEYLSELHEKGFLPQSTRGNSKHTQSQPRSHETYRTQHTYKGKSFTPGFPDPGVFEVFIKSSAFISAGYDRATRTLYLKFVRNRIYGYLNVPESVFTAFIGADSHGRFAHRHILSQYQCVSHFPTQQAQTFECNSN